MHNADKWIDAADSHAILISRISCKFAAWCHDPLTATYGVDKFLDPLLLGNFPSAPANAALPRIKLDIAALVKSHKADLHATDSAKVKDHWIREFLGQVDLWGIEYGIPDGSEGSEGSGNSNMAMYGSKDQSSKDSGANVERSPYSEATNNCKECAAWLCNGKGPMAGEGRDKCICYNT